MATPVRILFIDRSASDVRRMVDAMAPLSAYEVLHERVEDLHGLQEALASKRWDLVITEHTLPDMSFSRVLAELKQRGLDLPLIIASWVTGEEMFSTALRMGAADFVPKGSTARLATTVGRELRMRQMRRDTSQNVGRLGEMESRFTALFQGNPEAVLIVDAATLRIADANAAAAAFLGCAHERLTSLVLGELSTLDPQELEGIFRGVMRERSVRFKDRLRGANGLLRPVDAFAVLLPMSDRTQVYMLLHDDAVRWQAEHDLKDREARLRAITDNASILLWTSNESGDRDYFNRAWLDFRDRRLEEEVGEGWMSGVHPEDLAWCRGALRTAFKSRRPFSMEYRLLRVDGTYRWILDTGTPMYLGEGSFRGYMGQCIDISERREAEARHAQLAAAVEQSSDAVVITDPGLVIRYVNPTFLGLAACDRDELLGQPLEAWLSRSVIQLARQSLGRGEAWKGTLSIQPRGGSTRELDGRATPLRDEAGMVKGLIFLFRDAVQEAETDRQLRQNQKMEAIGLLAGGIAHDFNNLLSTILNAAELVRVKTAPDSPNHPKLEAIVHAVHCATGINRQILTLSNRREEELVAIDVSGVLREVMRLLKATLPENVDLRSHLTSGIWIEGDPGLLQQVLMNLALNALHAMRPQGGLLELTLSEQNLEPGNALPGLGLGRHAMLSVRDTGCGMDAATLERVFEPYFTTKARGEGTGLGLTMVHSIVKKHRGAIRVTSEPGQGSLFQLYFPCVEQGAQGAVAPGAPQTELSGHERILLQEPDGILAALAQQGLQDLGYRVSLCREGEEALRFLEGAPQDVDLVFLESGASWEATLQVGRSLRRVRADLPVLVMATASQPESSAGGLGVFQGMVAKPYGTQDLARAVRKCMDSMAKATPAAPKGAEPGTGMGVILLAEDSGVTRGMMRSWLSGEGYHVREAHDGQEAWEIFLNDAPSEGFALVLTDVVMPRMDGLELVRRIRKTDPRLPIAVLTTMEDRETVKEALHMGVNDFLNKPFEKPVLMDCVTRLMAEYASHRSAKRSAETAHAVRQAQRTLVAEAESDLPLFSLSESLTDAGGDVFRASRCADGSIVFVLADVVGHSVISSYAVASFLAMVSNFLAECPHLRPVARRGARGVEGTPLRQPMCALHGQIPCDPLKHLAQKLNRGIQEGPFSQVPVCVLLGQWSPATGRLHLLGAGIPHPCIYREARGQAAQVELNGTPLGIFEEPDVQEKVVRLRPGDRVLIGSDGFFELAASDGSLFEEHVPGQWASLKRELVEQALGSISGAARRHAAGSLTDDLLVVGFEQGELAVPDTELVLALPSDAAAIDGACEALEGFLASHGWDKGAPAFRLSDILLSVREGLTNALAHGNQGRPEAEILLSAWLDEHSLRVRIADEGPGYDIATHKSPDNPLSVRGRGIPLMRAHAQDVRMLGGELLLHFEKEAKHGSLDPEPAHPSRG